MHIINIFVKQKVAEKEDAPATLNRFINLPIFHNQTHTQRFGTIDYQSIRSVLKAPDCSRFSLRTRYSSELQNSSDARSCSASFLAVSSAR